MKRTETWLWSMLLLLTLIVVLEWMDIRMLREHVAVDEQRIAVEKQLINNYAEECGDRTDAPSQVTR